MQKAFGLAGNGCRSESSRENSTSLEIKCEREKQNEVERVEHDYPPDSSWIVGVWTGESTCYIVSGVTVEKS